MSCGCHGEARVRAGQTRPYDQCMACARKHVLAAWSLWGEFQYEMVNRDYCSAQLRDACEHCKYIHPEFAKRCREVAQVIEAIEDGSKSAIAERLEGLREEADHLYCQDYPEAQERLNSLITRG